MSNQIISKEDSRKHLIIIVYFIIVLKIPFRVIN